MVNITNILSTLTTLITASHILDNNGVLDAYGHISVRNPEDPTKFFMSRDLPPALVASYSDIVEYNVVDASPVDPNAPAGFLERLIHATIYNQYSNVSSVIHSHAPEIVSYTVNNVLFKPVHPLAGFISPKGAPNWDEEIIYNSTDPRFMLVNSVKFGDSFSSYFTDPPSPKAKPNPDEVVVLMRGHGFTTVGTSIKLAVVQAVYTRLNALMLTGALSTNHGFASTVKYLTKQEATDASQGPDKATVERPWSLYSAQVKVNPLYQNLGNGTVSGL